MHHHVPGQQMTAPAPGGIGVTDGQAVYYPPRPHMIAPMPWIPDGGQQLYTHHRAPQQQDWGCPTHGMAYAPPPPPAPSLQLTRIRSPTGRSPRWQMGLGGVSVNDEDSVGERTQTSLNGHGQ